MLFYPIQLYTFLGPQMISLGLCIVRFIHWLHSKWYGNSLFVITEKYIVIAKYLIK